MSIESALAPLLRLRRARGFAISAILVTSLGAAAVTTAFAVANGIVLRPLPYPHANRLVLTMGDFGAASFRDIRSRATDFSEIVFVKYDGGYIRTASGPLQVQAAMIPAGFFPLTGLVPNPGRAFASSEYNPTNSHAAVVSYRLAQKLFGDGRNPLNRTIEFGSRLLTIVGVTPRGFEFRLFWPMKPIDLWLPMALTPAQAHARSSATTTFFLARLKRGVSRDRAQQDLDGIAKALAAGNPHDSDLLQLRVWRLKRTRVRLAGRTVWPLFGFSFAFLAIAFIGVAGIMKARWLDRERQLAIRVALGARPGQLAALPIGEGIWIGAAAAPIALLLAFGGVRVFCATAPPMLLPRLSGVGIDWRVAAFGCLFALLSSILGGAVAAFRSHSHRAASTLGRGGSASFSMAANSGTGGTVLVIAQSAIATVLLAAAALMVSGAGRLGDAPLGFRPDGVIQAEMEQTAPGKNILDKTHNAHLWAHLLRTASLIPGVDSAALTGSPYALVPKVSFRTDQPGSYSPTETADWFRISPGYFHTLQVPLRAGRTFTPGDDLGTPPAVIVNRSFQRAFLGASALGHVIEARLPSTWTRLRVIGVVENDAMAGTWQSPDFPAIYTSYLQLPSAAAFLLVRTQAGAYPRMGLFRNAVTARFPGILVQHVHPMRQDIVAIMRVPRFIGSALSFLAFLGLLLVFAGILGVAAVSARRGKREAGIRRALGATPGSIARRALRTAVLLGGAGVVCGIVGARLVNGVLRAWLFGSQPFDPAILAVVAAIVLAACLLGTLIPIAAALRCEPFEILQQD